MKFTKLAAAVALTAAVATPAFAVDGTFGTTSTGSTVITANIGNLVRITNIDDPITLAPNAGGDLVYTDTICLFRNGTDNQNLNLTFSSATGAGAFEVTDGTNFVAYTVDVAAGALAGAVTEGAATAANGSTDNTPACTASGGNNASYTLTIPLLSIQSAVAGTYTDTLTILIAPI
ncbi:MAG: hypothetical protein K0S46_62 [Moraxellaceae bacterium]|jgi:hypothetical protein|nr:hypothetical protein [Moraxellaceae bacterium]